jgi:ribonucleotide monophosphatase NagD (HAD superfamily)
MTGDRPETDILGAKELGLHTALTLTGVTTAEQAAALPEDLRPEFVIRDLTELAGVAAGLQRA